MKFSTNERSLLQNFILQACDVPKLEKQAVFASTYLTPIIADFIESWEKTLGEVANGPNTQITSDDPDEALKSIIALSKQIKEIREEDPTRDALLADLGVVLASAILKGCVETGADW